FRKSSALGGRDRKTTNKHALAKTFANANVNINTLPMYQEPLSVPEPAVTAEVHQSLDVHLHFTPQIALDLEFAFDNVADRLDLGVGKLFDPLGVRDLGLVADALRGHCADSVNVREGVCDVLATREIYASDSCHGFLS